MSVGTKYTTGSHTAIVVNAKTILDKAICSINEEAARLTEQIDALVARRDDMLNKIDNSLEVQAHGSEKVVLSDGMRKEVIYEAMHQAAQRDAGQTMVVDLGFEPNENEKAYGEEMMRQLDDPMFGNTCSIRGNLVAFSEYKN